MSVCGKHENRDYVVVNFIYKSVLLCYTTAPLPLTVTAQRLRLSSTSTRMVFQFLNETLDFQERLLLMFGKFENI